MGKKNDNLNYCKIYSTLAMICSCEYWKWNQADLYLVLMQVKILTVMFSHTYKAKCNTERNIVNMMT